MVSTRLQSNSNSSCGDNSMQPTSDIVPKCSFSTGCVTRSGASTHPTSCHSKEVIQPKILGSLDHIACQSKDIQHVQPKAASVNLLDLPVELIEKIVSFCGYGTASNLRLVNKQMDQISGSLLNFTFNRLQNAMFTRLNNIKAQMPRRESARRAHPLTCEFDIIETICMRLNLLQMTFGKHIERKIIYFFPGGVLDEVYRILDFIRVTPKLPRPYRVTDELFDLTTMAMEYFKEKLESKLPEITYYESDLINYSPGRKSPNDTNTRVHFDDFLTIDEDPPQSNMVLRKRIRKIKQGMKLYNSQLTTMKRELKSYKTKMADQQKTILDYATRLDENDKKSEEMSRKYSTLLQELNKCKTELQYWRSKSPMNPVCGACGVPVASLPLEDLEALSNQGIVIPMVVMRPLLWGEEEAVVQVKTEEAALKEPVDVVVKCEPEETVDGKDNSIMPVESADQNTSLLAGCNLLNNSSNINDNSDTISKERLPRPAKRKSVSEKPTSYKRPRGILKLRSKTIRKN